MASFTDIVPRSIAVSADNRMFLCCSRGHSLDAQTLVELKDGRVIPYPNAEINKIDVHNPTLCLFSAMSAAIDGDNNLWVLDNGRQNRTVVYGGAKLVGINLKTNKIFKIILLKNLVLSPNVVLYELKIDLLHGKSGTALVTASGSVAPGSIIVTDLETGHTMRRLHEHNTLCPDHSSMASIEGEMVRIRKSNESQYDWLPGSFGLTINGSQDLLYYSAVASQHIYSVELNKLCDANATEKEVEQSIKHIDYKVDLGTGIECDRQNSIYLSDIDHNTIWKRHPDGTTAVVARGGKLGYCDHLLAKDGYLYVTTSQYRHDRNSKSGQDERIAPFEVVRISVDPIVSTTVCSRDL